jgi:hypothetical protein
VLHDHTTLISTPKTPPGTPVGAFRRKVNSSKSLGLDDSLQSAIPTTPAIEENLRSLTPGLYQPQSSSNFSTTYENGIIKFKIRSSGAEKSSDASNKSIDPDKFNYNKEPSEEEKSLLADIANSNKYLSENYTIEKERGDILKLLKEASTDTIEAFKSTKLDSAKLDKDFFIAVMKVA